MPPTIDRALFLTGLVMFAVAMSGFFAFGPTSKADSAIDAFHWVMLIGAVLQLPFAINNREGWHIRAVAIVMTIGLVCTIGMCIVDFVLWSMPSDGLRDKVAAELISTPSIWPVFMEYGPEEVLYAGYSLASVSALRATKLGPLLVLAGATLAIAGGTWFNVAGAASVLAGFILCFRARARHAPKVSPA
jgi:hypothetical protein